MLNLAPFGVKKASILLEDHEKTYTLKKTDFKARKDQRIDYGAEFQETNKRYLRPVKINTKEDFKKYTLLQDNMSLD